MIYDVGIIGAGAVGGAIARKIPRMYPKKSVVVFERFHASGLETSRLNSGVLHSGFHEAPDSLKSILAHRGSKMAAHYLQAKGLPLARTGMLIAVSRQSLAEGLHRELSSFFSLLKRGWRQGIDFEFLTPLGIRRLEPQIKALGGIFIPNVWITDPVMFVRSLCRDAVYGGAHFLFGAEVIDIRLTRDSYIVVTPKEEIEAKILINAAGLCADEISRLAGVNGYEISYCRGEYYEVVSEKKKLVTRLVYPVVPRGYPGKGIHFSPRVDGRLFIGPNARFVPRRDYYEEEKTPKEEFLDPAKRFCPELTAEDIAWAYSGIRPKLAGGGSDFVISLDRAYPPLINLIGIESPGLSSCMGIAEHVYRAFLHRLL